MTLDEAREVVAGWMEPMPKDRSGATMQTVKWWVLVNARANSPWVPTRLSLDRLREVESRRRPPGRSGAPDIARGLNCGNR